MDLGTEILELPTDFSLGTVIVYELDGRGPSSILDARGPLKVPRTAKLFLDVSQEVCDDLSRIRFVPERLHTNGLSFVKKDLTGANFGELARVGLAALTVSFCSGLRVGQLWQLGVAHSLEHLSLAHSPISCTDYSWVLQFPLLRTLLLDGTGASDACLRVLPQLAHLEELSLGYSTLDGSGFPAIWKIPTLKRVSLSKASVDDRIVEGVGGCGSLSALRLDDTSVSDEGVGALVRESLRGGLKLRFLGLRSCPITDRALVYASSLNCLAVVDLHNTAVTPQGVAFLKEALPSCRVLF